MIRPVVYMTRIETFSACHRLHNSILTNEENRRLYGKCNNPNGHGHNYRLEVTLRGPVNTNTGMIMDLQMLRSIIQEHVLNHLDHKNIDLDIDHFRLSKLVSTTENICIFIWNRLVTTLPDNMLFEVKLWETDQNVFAYRGEVA